MRLPIRGLHQHLQEGKLLIFQTTQHRVADERRLSFAVGDVGQNGPGRLRAEGVGRKRELQREGFVCFARLEFSQSSFQMCSGFGVFHCHRFQQAQRGGFYQRVLVRQSFEQQIIVQLLHAFQCPEGVKAA